MRSFFIIPFKPTQWKEVKSDLRIDPLQYQTKMQQHWPESKIDFRPTDPHYLLWWELRRKNEFGLQGGLLQDHQIVSFERNPKEEVLTEFVFWHRALIPGMYQLFISPENSWESLELKPGMTEYDVITFIRRF